MENFPEIVCDIFIYLSKSFFHQIISLYLYLLSSAAVVEAPRCMLNRLHKNYILYGRVHLIFTKKIKINEWYVNSIRLHLLPGNLDPCNLFTIVTLSYCCLHHACQFMVVISLNTPQLCEYVLPDHCQNTGSVNQIKIQITLPFVIILLM